MAVHVMCYILASYFFCFKVDETLLITLMAQITPIMKMVKKEMRFSDC